MLTFAFDEESYDKVVFDAYEKEKKVHSLQGKVDSAGDHAKHKRPWGALGTMMSRANMRSETKTAMAQIGISLHGVKSKAFYQFVCKPCSRATDMLFPVA